MLTTSGVVTATTSGDKGNRWGPGIVPHILRGFAIILASGEPVNPGQVLLRHISLASGSTASTITAINTTSLDASGNTIFKQNLNVEILPGTQVQVNVPAIVSGDLSFNAVIYVEPRWERPANIVGMREST